MADVKGMFTLNESEGEVAINLSLNLFTSSGNRHQSIFSHSFLSNVNEVLVRVHLAQFSTLNNVFEFVRSYGLMIF